MKFIPSPGIIFIEPIVKEDTFVVLGKTITKILKGKVLAVGPDVTTVANATLHSADYAKVGDLVYFLSYETEFDNAMIEGKKYYFVKLEDIRGVYEK